MRIPSIVLLSMLVAACGTLPRDGPETRQVLEQSGDLGTSVPYSVVDLSYAAAEVANRHFMTETAGLLSLPPSGEIDLISIGDTLSVAVIEPGGGLFGAVSVAPTEAGAPAAASQALPPLVVDRSGAITVPFAGSVDVAGLTIGQASEAIRRALRGRTVNPQVIVSVSESASNGVTVLGSVGTPGRLPLRRGAGSVLDIVAAAGGPTVPPENVQVVITRNGQSSEVPFTTLLASPGENVLLSPGDQINLVLRPRRYATFGALGDIAEVDMPTGDTSLAGALAKAGGLDNQASNAKAVFVFRFERPEVAQTLGVMTPATSKGVPVVYKLNLEEPAGFFTANTFLVRAEDVIYSPRAGSAELRKFFEFVQAITRVVYDVTVFSTLNTD